MKSFSEIFKREIEVAFFEQTQPIWLRITKYVILGILIYALREYDLLWLILLALACLFLSLHFWYRYKTKSWTQSYRGWKFQSKTDNKNELDIE